MSGYAAEAEPGSGALASLSKVVLLEHVERATFLGEHELVARDPVEAVREMKGKDSKSDAHHRQLHPVSLSPVERA